MLSIFEITYEFLVYHENEFGNSKLTRLNFNWVCACTSTSFIIVRCKYSMNIKPELLWIIIILQIKNLWTIKKNLCDKYVSNKLLLDSSVDEKTSRGPRSYYYYSNRHAHKLFQFFVILWRLLVVYFPPQLLFSERG